MNNTLTAKEWLEKETERLGIIISQYNFYEDFMEKYANYKNRILEDRIKEFRDNIANKSKIWESWDVTPSLSEQYDKHFNINKETI